MKTFFINLLLSTLAIFTPLTPVLLSVGFLIFCDFFSGLYKAYKTCNKITSNKMSNTISKMVLYNLAILSGFVFEVYILHGLFPITKIISGAIGMIELKSISENVYIITGVSYFERIKELFKRKPDTDTDTDTEDKVEDKHKENPKKK